MLPSTACALPQGSAPDAFGACQAPARKSGGTFLPTARQGRTFTSRPAPLPSQEAPSDWEPTPNERPVTPRPTSGRNTTPPERRGPASPRSPHGADRSRRHAATPWDRKASPHEKDPALHLDDRGDSEMIHAAEATDAGRPALGRAAAVRELAPRSCLREQAGAGNAARRFRVLKRSVSRVFDRGNHSVMRI
jgi:hypothetical protein